MDRLSVVLILVTGPTLVGGFVTVVLSLGLVTLPWLLGAGALGLALTYPAAYGLSKVIKRRDPDWDHRRDRRLRAQPARHWAPALR